MPDKDLTPGSQQPWKQTAREILEKMASGEMICCCEKCQHIQKETEGTLHEGIGEYPWESEYLECERCGGESTEIQSCEVARIVLKLLPDLADCRAKLEKAGKAIKFVRESACQCHLPGFREYKEKCDRCQALAAFDAAKTLEPTIDPNEGKMCPDCGVFGLEHMTCPKCAYRKSSPYLPDKTPAPNTIKDGVPHGWQPIETAPKDGTVFIALLQGPYITNASNCKWRRGKDCWVDYRGYHIGPTHWMPLSMPPAKTGEKGE